ncbi:hypothetical protein NDU88_007341 [Pleurodeles waltl]|uniref:Uncharacterized protein n=1 Tax=Pleurodeles waltl TaxID=8319 RepID=A0AAV7RUL9_PLEWA|nr:hypothetical protein NDU88_007341 [Pleurodeles waltl]
MYPGKASQGVALLSIGYVLPKTIPAELEGVVVFPGPFYETQVAGRAWQYLVGRWQYILTTPQGLASGRARLGLHRRAAA